METSEQTAELDAAMAEFQAEVCTAPKGGQNPHFRSHFTRMEDAVKAAAPITAKHGLSVTQWVEGRNLITTRVAHKSGQWMRGTLEMDAVKPDPQARGSAITYGRRYAYLAALGLAPEDDDGNAASAPEPKPVPVSDKPWDYVIPFGKNEGTRLGDLSDSQLRWYADECNHDVARANAQAEQAHRRGEI